jgi:hypothetical protein
MIRFTPSTMAEKGRAHAIPIPYHTFLAGLIRFRESLFERRVKT